MVDSVPVDGRGLGQQVIDDIDGDSVIDVDLNQRSRVLTVHKNCTFSILVWDCIRGLP